MKQIKQFAGACVIAALAFVAPNAKAGGALNSFGITNNLQGGAAAVVYYGFPTNSINPTNGFPMLTGHQVSIGSFDRIGVNLQGFLLNTGAATHITFMFTAGYGNGVPQVTPGTNLFTYGNTVLLQNDWTSTNNWVMLDIPIPATTTNWYNWSTNFVGAGAFPIIDANYLGVGAISNYLTAQNFLTNCSLGVNTKIINRAFISN